MGGHGFAGLFDEGGGEGGCSVGDEECDGGPCDGFAAAVDAYAFYGVVAVAQAGGVHESEEVVAYLEGVFDYVACGAVYVADYCPVVAEEGVEQG